MNKREVMLVDGPMAGKMILVPVTGVEVEFPLLEASPEYRSHNEIGKGITYLIKRTKEGKWIGVLDND